MSQSTHEVKQTGRPGQPATLVLATAIQAAVTYVGTPEVKMLSSEATKDDDVFTVVATFEKKPVKA